MSRYNFLYNGKSAQYRSIRKQMLFHKKNMVQKFGKFSFAKKKTSKNTCTQISNTFIQCVFFVNRKLIVKF